MDDNAVDCPEQVAGGGAVCFNCYHYNTLLIIWRPGHPPPIVMQSKEGVTQGDPLSMVLYGTVLVPLAEELQEGDTAVLSPFYPNDAVFEGKARRSAKLITLLANPGLARGYYVEPAKSIYI